MCIESEDGRTAAYYSEIVNHPAKKCVELLRWMTTRGLVIREDKYYREIAAKRYVYKITDLGMKALQRNGYRLNPVGKNTMTNGITRVRKVGFFKGLALLLRGRKLYFNIQDEV